MSYQIIGGRRQVFLRTGSEGQEIRILLVDILGYMLWNCAILSAVRHHEAACSGTVLVQLRIVVVPHVVHLALSRC